jgi:hypothetical protein
MGFNMGERGAMVAWMLLIAVSVAGLVVSAALRAGNQSMAYSHFAIAAGVSILFALLGVRKLIALHAAGATRSAIAAEGARSTGLVWAWVALVIGATYGTGVLTWKEWLFHFIGIIGVAAGCLAIAAALDRSASQPREDETMLTLARYLGIGQLVGMMIVIIGFLVGGQMTRFLVERFADGPAKNVMFFGAVAVAAITGAALKYAPRSARLE